MPSPARLVFLVLVALLPLPAFGEGGDTQRIVIVEVVTDPQTDWNGDGTVTGSDEFIELVNEGGTEASLAGWRLVFNDTTPAAWDLSGTLGPGARKAFVNPPGEVNNNAAIELVAPDGTVASGVVFGSWVGAFAPDGNAQGPDDESLRFIGSQWSKGHATPDLAADVPFVSPDFPFDWASERWWDPGGHAVAVGLGWTDSDRSYTSAVFDLDYANGTQTDVVAAGKVSGRWSATWNLTTPAESFRFRWSLVADGAFLSVGEWVDVSVDRSPPVAPILRAPDWSRRGPVDVSVDTTTDEGIGRVEYLVQRESNLSWTQVTDWSSTPPQQEIPWGADADDVLVLRALARDAYGNLAEGAPAQVRSDEQAPTAPESLSTTGYDHPLLAWGPATDAGSGIHEIRVARESAAGNQSWVLPATARSLEDEGLGRGVEATFEVWAVDGAGNEGPRARHAADHEGLFPHVSAIRLSKEAWGSGQLSIHADFDRRMDTDVAPGVFVAQNGTKERLEGRWLANETTYLIQLPSSESYSAGSSLVRVETAKAPNGRSLWAARERGLTIDPDPPNLEWDHVDGWVNATGLGIAATDAVDPAPKVHVRIDNGTQQDFVQAARVPIKGAARVTAWASDAAGLRSPAKTLKVRVDSAAPTHGEVVRSGRAALPYEFALEDQGAGLDEGTLRLRAPDGTEILHELHGSMVRFQVDAGPVDLSVMDVVGNELRERLQVPSPSPSNPAEPAGLTGSASDPASEASEWGVRDLSVPRAVADAAWSWEGALGFTVAGLATAGGAYRIRSERKRQRKRHRGLAARLLRLRRRAQA